MACAIGARAMVRIHQHHHTATTVSEDSLSSLQEVAPEYNTRPKRSYITTGFGGRTESSGSGVSYKGNVGKPYGSNIIEVSSMDAKKYQYVVQFDGPQIGQWTLVIWNKIGPDGLVDGWFGHACKSFTLAPGQTLYIAFAEDSQGGWTAAPGPYIPTDSYGGYAATWGEFAFGSSINWGWSGFDVSAIAAQNAGLEVQGMKICDNLIGTCSFISPKASKSDNAYLYNNREVDGIGGNVAPGPVRLVVTLDYQG
ncbi:Allergen [Penicillium cinerascens]|uniref:Allergen n=1 Tax=Penicillium cinerascens TaxID=70096 RepID=A0A9W9TA63_9EURO|nr:Allergen [Penicillium cinerascens]KAJ5215267.1 Allergen [Penicillium cinerascens]